LSATRLGGCGVENSEQESKSNDRFDDPLGLCRRAAGLLALLPKLFSALAKLKLKLKLRLSGANGANGGSPRERFIESSLRSVGANGATTKQDARWFRTRSNESVRLSVCLSPSGGVACLKTASGARVQSDGNRDKGNALVAHAVSLSMFFPRMSSSSVRHVTSRRRLSLSLSLSLVVYQQRRDGSLSGKLFLQFLFLLSPLLFPLSRADSSFDRRSIRSNTESNPNSQDQAGQREEDQRVPSRRLFLRLSFNQFLCFIARLGQLPEIRDASIFAVR